MGGIEDIKNIKPPVQKELFRDFTAEQEEKRKEKEIMESAVSPERIQRYSRYRKEGFEAEDRKRKKKANLKDSEKENFKVLWSINLPTSGANNRYGDTIDDEYSFGDDGKWRINGEKKEGFTDDDMEKYIKREYRDEKMIQSFLKEIEEAKEKLKNNLK